MQIVINPKKSEWSEILKRPTQTVDDIEETVNQIFNEVNQKGDEAIKKYTSYFDGITLDEMEVSVLEINAAENFISMALQKAIKLAKQNIEAFHKAQKTFPDDRSES